MDMLESKLNFLDHVQCHVFEKNIAQLKQESSCWELAAKMNDFRFDYNVCHDCIVHIYSTENDEPSRQQLENILRKRKNIQH